LDRLLFAGGDQAIRHVMVAGRWVVRDRRHAAEEQLSEEFARVMKDLSSS
jgi:formimidoylglutamate deiminase